jgi:hypothetical protein
MKILGLYVRNRQISLGLLQNAFKGVDDVE